MKRREVSVGNVLMIYMLGVAAGVQVALYLFDRFDDGVADLHSGLIGALLVLLGLGVIVFVFRSRPPAG